MYVSNVTTCYFLLTNPLDKIGVGSLWDCVGQYRKEHIFYEPEAYSTSTKRVTFGHS